MLKSETIWPTALCPDNPEQTALSKSPISAGNQEEAYHNWPSPSGPFVFQSTTCALETEYVENCYVQQR